MPIHGVKISPISDSNNISARFGLGTRRTLFSTTDSWIDCSSDFVASYCRDFPTGTSLIYDIDLSFRLIMASDDTLPFPHPRSCPAKAEITLHKYVIKSLEQDIIVLENEISKLQTRLRHIQQQKDNRASYISPFRRLPSEILSEIVYVCLYYGIKLTTLTQTCGTLRDIVVGMPPLWSEILLLSAHHKPRHIYRPNHG
jgi:hypothetical protein